MDLKNISIPDEKMVTMHSYTANMKLKRLMFALDLYPDWRLASVFAGIGNTRGFLRYWLGREKTSEIQNEVEQRKADFDENTDICVLLENAFEKYRNGHDYLNPYLTNRELVVEGLEEKDTFFMDQDEMLDVVGINRDWSYEYILENLDNIIEIERLRRRSAFVEAGKYWIVAYRQVNIDGVLRPFVILARMSEVDENDIIAVQGIWPLDCMKAAIDTLVPMPYTATLEDITYICVETEPVEDGIFNAKYTNVYSCE